MDCRIQRYASASETFNTNSWQYAGLRSGREHSRRQNIGKPDSAKELSSHAIRYHIYNFCTVLRWINVYSEGSFAERSVDDFRNRLCYRHYIRIKIGRASCRER